MADPRITYTPNLKLSKLPANFHVWAEIMNNNLMSVDAAVSGFVTFQNLRGAWTNSTAYLISDTVIDMDTAIVWQCQVAHTSSSIPTTFLQDRTLFPLNWTVYSLAATARGVWIGPGTSYAINDFVVNGLQYAVCINSHVSTASFANDVAAGEWSILIDLTTVGFVVMPSPGGPVDANKFTITNSAGTAYGLFVPDYALNLLGATSLGTALLRTGSQASARSTIDAAQTTDTITQPNSDSSTKYASTQFVKNMFAINPSTYVGTAPPASPVDGQMWFYTDASTGGATTYIRYNDGNSTQWVPAFSAPTAVNTIDGYLFGLNTTTTTTNVTVGAGKCADVSASTVMSNTANLTKLITAPWAAGSGAGGLGNGVAQAAGTWYYLFAGLAGGSFDMYYDTSTVGANKPAAFSTIRRIGEVFTDVGSLIYPQMQDGDYFAPLTRRLAYSATNPGTTGQVVVCGSPTGIMTQARFSFMIYQNDAANPTFALLSDPGTVDFAPSFGSVMDTPNSSTAAGTVAAAASHYNIHTDALGRIRYRLALSNANTLVAIYILGWMDTRGRV